MEDIFSITENNSGCLISTNLLKFVLNDSGKEDLSKVLLEFFNEEKDMFCDILCRLPKDKLIKCMNVIKKRELIFRTLRYLVTVYGDKGTHILAYNLIDYMISTEYEYLWLVQSRWYVCETIRPLNCINLGNEPVPSMFHCNPSIIKVDDEYIVNVRLVNYTQTNANDYKIPSGDEYVRTSNFIVHFDRNFTEKRRYNLEDKAVYPKFSNRNIKGYEDIRLWRVENGIIYGICTLVEYKEPLHMGLLKIKDNVITDAIPLDPYDFSSTQKNWLPFVDGDDKYMIFSYLPFRILKMTNETNYEVITGEANDDFKGACSFRGSASPIPYKGKWLMLIHQVSIENDRSRVYISRFVEFEKWKLTRVSRYFTFERKGVNIALGMCQSFVEDEIIITYGMEDSEAKLAIVSYDEVERLFERT